MKNVFVVFVAFILVGCSSSNDVVHSGFLQKRKYKKGYHLSLKKKEKKQNEELVIVRNVKVSKNSKVKEVKAAKKSLIIVKEIKAEPEEILTASTNEELKIKTYSVLDKIEQKVDKKKQEFYNALEDEEPKEIYESTYSWLKVLGILSCIMIFGIFILKKIKELGREKINSSKSVNIHAKIVTVTFIIGLLMLISVLVLVGPDILSAAAIGLGGIGVFIFGVIMLVNLFKALNDLSKKDNTELEK